MNSAPSKKARPNPPAPAQAGGDDRTVEITRDSFKAVKQLMNDSDDFDEFFAAAHASAKLQEYCSDRTGELGLATGNIKDIYASMATSGCTSQVLANINQVIQRLLQTFQVMVTIELHTLSGEHIHTLELELEYGQWQSSRVHSAIVNFKKGIRQKANHLIPLRRALVVKLFGAFAKTEGNFDEVIIHRERMEKFSNPTRDYTCSLVVSPEQESDGFSLLYDGQWHRVGADSVSSESVSSVYAVARPGRSGRIYNGCSLYDGTYIYALEATDDGKNINVVRKRGEDCVPYAILKFDDEDADSRVQRFLNEVDSFPDKLDQILGQVERQHPGTSAILRLDDNLSCLRFVQGTQSLQPETLLMDLADGSEQRTGQSPAVKTMALAMRWNVVIGEECTRTNEADSDWDEI